MVRLASLLSLLALCLFATTAQAGWFDDQVRDDDFLTVDQAFQASGWHDDDTLYIGFENAEGYYLYRHRFAIESREEGVTLGEPQLPAGEPKTDEFLGETRVFYDRVVMAVPFEGSPGDALDVAVTFQGCADAGLCYPPETWSLAALPGSPPAAFAAAGPVSEGGGSERAPPDDPAGDASADVTTVPLSEDGRFRSLLDDAAPATVLGLFFLAGLGLTFTPCVLPMIPILSSIIVGQNAGRSRALGLSASYVGGMAATYATIGVLMGLFGAGLNLQARLQSPWVLIPFAILFVLFALAMFGLFDMKLSPRLAQRIDGWQQRLQRSGPAGLALAGALSVAVVSPCVSAPLAGALVFISTTGDALMGGAALLALALGMGVPLLLVGTFGTTLLPRGGAWMNGVKVAFGVLMLGIAIWLVERLVPGPMTLLLWGALAVGTALALGALTVNQRQGWARTRQTAGILLLAWGIALVLGAARGGEDPLRPLAGLGTPTTEDAATPLDFTRITTLAQLDDQLTQAARRGQPVFVDFTAEWCISCKIMEREVFPSPGVAEQLAQFHRIRADITETNADSRALLEQYGLFGPPGLLFFADGTEVRQARILGEVDATSFSAHLERVLEYLETGEQSA